MCVYGVIFPKFSQLSDFSMIYDLIFSRAIDRIT